MWDFNTGQALGLLGRTMPLVLRRAGARFGTTCDGVAA